MDKDGKIKLLKDKIEQVDNLIVNANQDEVHKWKEETLMILDHLIGEDSKYYRSFEKISYRAGVFIMGDVEGNKLKNQEACKEDLKRAESSLKAIMFGLEKGLF